MTCVVSSYGNMIRAGALFLAVIAVTTCYAQYQPNDFYIYENRSRKLKEINDQLEQISFQQKMKLHDDEITRMREASERRSQQMREDMNEREANELARQQVSLLQDIERENKTSAFKESNNWMIESLKQKLEEDKLKRQAFDEKMKISRLEEELKRQQQKSQNIRYIVSPHRSIEEKLTTIFSPLKDGGSPNFIPETLGEARITGATDQQILDVLSAMPSSHFHYQEAYKDGHSLYAIAKHLEEEADLVAFQTACFYTFVEKDRDRIDTIRKEIENSFTNSKPDRIEVSLVKDIRSRKIYSDNELLIALSKYSKVPEADIINTINKGYSLDQILSNSEKAHGFIPISADFTPVQ